MNTLLKALAALLAGFVGFALVGIAVTEALDPYIWPSAMLGLPVGLLAGVATAALAYLGLTALDERASTGSVSERTRRRTLATVAAVLGFAGGGGLAVAVLASQQVGVATAILSGGLPVGLVTAAVAAYAVGRRNRRHESPPGSTT
ncbi:MULTISPECIES: hypothetical protein [Salinibaculum]|uniref:hypothetical protein n=1 Tax=Salinibaculum TaxID=2732368 RepID=UPI0030D5C9A3